MVTISEQMRSIYRDYQREHGVRTVCTNDLFAWAHRKKRWAPQTSNVRRQFSNQLSRALRQDYYIDRQGRKVRSKHAVVRDVKGKQMSFWDDIREADSGFMNISFKQKRKQISGSCKQLKVDVDSFNENRAPDDPYQLVLDFTEDVMEMEIAETMKKVTRDSIVDKSKRHLPQSPEIRQSISL